MFGDDVDKTLSLVFSSDATINDDAVAFAVKNYVGVFSQRICYDACNFKVSKAEYVVKGSFH